MDLYCSDSIAIVSDSAERGITSLLVCCRLLLLLLLSVGLSSLFRFKCDQVLPVCICLTIASVTLYFKAICHRYISLPLVFNISCASASSIFALEAFAPYNIVP